MMMMLMLMTTMTMMMMMSMTMMMMMMAMMMAVSVVVMMMMMMMMMMVMMMGIMMMSVVVMMVSRSVMGRCSFTVHCVVHHKLCMAITLSRRMINLYCIVCVVFRFLQGTRAALTAILYHVKKFDAELGDFREYAKRTE